MTRLNNKGFAVSTILYGMLSLIIIILMLIFGLMRANKNFNESLVDSLTTSMNSCATIEAKLENCLFNNNTSCNTLKEKYKECLGNGGANNNINNNNNNNLISCDEDSNTLVCKILNDNTPYADNVPSEYVTGANGIDFSKISSDTNGKGLYYTSTNTEDNKTTYYFRGDVQNNYVKFGVNPNGSFWKKDLYWRIVRVNEDGSIRIIYQGDSVTDDGTISEEEIKYNQSYACNANLGYMYGSTSSETYELTHANANDSVVKISLDEWYESVLSTHSSYLIDAGFCNDRSVFSGTGIGTELTVFKASNRIENNAPQFACPNADNDLFTTSASNKGNKALTNPIGLITADEVIYAGANTNYNNTDYYLYTDYNYWTMTPSSYKQGVGRYASIYVVYNNFVDDYNTANTFGVRPVINLNSGVTVSSGDGTANSPYIINVN